MGPEAASELEPAGAREGFCLPGATSWEGSAAASSARGGQQQGCSQPALPGQHQPLWVGVPCSRMASPRQSVLSPRVGACPQALCLWGNVSSALPGMLYSSSCAPVPGENWDSCTSGCCLSALVWSWHACQLEKLHNCSWSPLEMRKGSPAWVLGCLPSAGLLPD